MALVGVVGLVVVHVPDQQAPARHSSARWRRNAAAYDTSSTTNWVRSGSCLRDRHLAGEDPSLHVTAVEAMNDAHNPEGTIDEEGAQAVHDVLAASTPEIAAADVDVSKTYTNEFVEP